MSRTRTIVALFVTLIAASAWWWSTKDGAVALEPGPRIERTIDAGASPSVSTIESPPIEPNATRRSMADAGSASSELDPEFVLVCHAVDHHTERFLANVEMRLVVRRPNEPVYQAHGVSDAEGRLCAPFHVVEDPGSLPRMSYTSSGLAFLAVLEGYASYDGMPWTVDQGEPAVVDGHQRVDAGQVRMRRGTRLSGRVVDTHGVGIEGAVVHAIEDWRLPSSLFLAQPMAVATTDRLGGFATTGRLPMPSSGNELLVATTARGIGTAVVPMVLGRDTAEGIDIVVGPQVALDVRVSDEAGAPVAGAEVRVEPRFPPFDPYGNAPLERIWPASDTALVEAFTRTTDAAGIAAFDALPLQAQDGFAGSSMPFSPYAFVVEHEGFARFQGGPQPPSPGVRTTLRAVLVRTGNGIVSGRIVGADGKSISGATVAIGGEHPMSTVSGADGGFELRGFDAPKHAVALTVELEGFATSEREVSLGPTDEVRDLEIVLHQVRSITGIVVGADGLPIAGAHVAASGQGTYVALRESDGSMGRTGRDGRFELQRTFAGEWTLMAEPPHALDEWDPCVPVHAQGGARDVRVVLTRVLGPLARVEIDIVDAETGKELDPIGADVVPARRAPVGVLTYPAAIERTFGTVIVPRARVGAWRIWVAAPDHAPGALDFDVRDASPQHLVLRVGQPGSVQGRVEYGAPEHRATGPSFVLLVLDATSAMPGGNAFRSGPRFFATASIEADGRFRAENLVPGPWRLSFRNSISIVEERVQIASEATSEVVLRTTLAAHLVLAGEVRGLGAEAPHGYMSERLVPADPGASTRESYSSIENGRYRSETVLTPGKWHYVLEWIDEAQPVESQRDAPKWEGDVELAPGQTLEVSLPL